MKIKSILILVTISLILLTGCSIKNNSVNKDIPVNQISASFAINRDDLNAVTGAADYVFVAYVNDEIGTVYKYPVSIETENGFKEISSPYTNYSITVIDNIKGKLKKNTKIEIQKNGGLSKDGSKYLLFDKDKLLTVGKYHIISAFAQPDGSLLISGPNSNEILEYNNKADILLSKEYKKYPEAFKNEIKMDRKRAKSIYEE